MSITPQKGQDDVMEESEGRLLRARGRAMKYCLLFITIRNMLPLRLPAKPEKKAT